jgi:hypothetical protein
MQGEERRGKKEFKPFSKKKEALIKASIKK